MLVAKPTKLCVLLCLALVTADDLTLFNVKDKYNKKAVITSARIHNSLISVVTCDKILPHDTTLKCDISQSTVDSWSKVDTCEFVLDGYVYEASGHPLTSKKTILISHTKEEDDEQYLKYTIVNFPDCNTTEAKVKFESFDDVFYNFQQNKDAIWINDDETFDILYDDDKVCGDKMCRLTLDAQGKRVREPNPFFIPLVGSIRYVKRGSSSHSLIVTEHHYDEGEFFVRLSLINADGQQVVLKKVFYESYGSYYALKDQDVSTSQESIRLCSRNNRYGKVDCEMLDDNGKTTSMISVDVKQNVEAITVENLANKEFLLLVEGREIDVLMKAKSDGSVLGVAVLSHLTHRIPLNYDTYIDVSDNQYCVTKKGFGYAGLEVLKECLSDSDFH